MVYRFKLVSDEVTNFSRVIEIDSENTFFQLRNAILESVDFSKDEFDSFFLCDEDWQRMDEITLEDMGDSSSDQDLWIMDDTPISQLIEEEGQKLVFVFDYMTDRSFFMELKEILPMKNLKEPVCIIKQGKGPVQTMDVEEFEKKIDAKNVISKDVDFEELDLLNEADFNEDEIDDGFDIMPMN